jgi:hypothetical protein
VGEFLNALFGIVAASQLFQVVDDQLHWLIMFCTFCVLQPVLTTLRDWNS